MLFMVMVAVVRCVAVLRPGGGRGRPHRFRLLFGRVLRFTLRIFVQCCFREVNKLGSCDVCDVAYDVSSRDGRCGDCGNCSDHCVHVGEV